MFLLQEKIFNLNYQSLWFYNPFFKFFFLLKNIFFFNLFIENNYKKFDRLNTVIIIKKNKKSA